MVECLNDYTDDYFNGQDHLYSTVALYEIDSDSGNFSLAERYEYDAYGEARVMDSAYVLQSTSVAENPYTFTGRRQDTLDDGGYSVMYYRARYYDTDTGRFMQRDPLGYVDGMSLYEYVTSNPINYSDAYGLFKCTDKCKAGDIDYDWDSVVVPNGYPPDIYQKPGQFEDLLGAVGFADLISQIGLPLDMIVEQLIGIGDPTMPIADNLVEKLKDYLEELKNNYVNMYLEIEIKKCKKKRCGFLNMCWRYDWVPNENVNYYKCTSGAYNELSEGLYRNWDHAMLNEIDCFMEFYSKFEEYKDELGPEGVEYELGDDNLWR